MSVYVDENYLAKKLKVSKRTLQGQRQRGVGIPYVKFGRLVRYNLDTVGYCLSKSERNSTSDIGEVGARNE